MRHEATKKNIWISFIEYLVDYGPVTLTVITAIITNTVTSSIEPNAANARVENALQAVLIILALLATTQLVDRFRFMRKLDNKVNKLETTLNAIAAGKAEVFSEIPDLRERMSWAKSISISGLSLKGTSLEYKQLLRERASKRARLRILIINPEDENLVEIVGRSRTGSEQSFQHSKDRLKTYLNLSRDNFLAALDATKKERDTGIRFLLFQPSYGIWLFDEETDHAEVWVEMYPYRDTRYFTVHFTCSENPYWFDYFKDQFIKMWESGKPVDQLFME